MIRGLDDDEVDFLDVIDKAKSVAERKQQQEELNELQDFRQKVASMQEKSQDDVSANNSSLLILFYSHLTILYRKFKQKSQSPKW